LDFSFYVQRRQSEIYIEVVMTIGNYGPSGVPYYHSEFSSRYRDDQQFLFIVSICTDRFWTPELGSWLLQFIGKNHENWEWLWDDTWIFEFKEEEDKVKFILRWL